MAPEARGPEVAAAWLRELATAAENAGSAGALALASADAVAARLGQRSAALPGVVAALYPVRVCTAQLEGVDEATGAGAAAPHRAPHGNARTPVTLRALRAAVPSLVAAAAAAGHHGGRRGSVGGAEGVLAEPLCCALLDVMRDASEAVWRCRAFRSPARRLCTDCAAGRDDLLQSSTELLQLSCVHTCRRVAREARDAAEMEVEHAGKAGEHVGGVEAAVTRLAASLARGGGDDARVEALRREGCDAHATSLTAAPTEGNDEVLADLPDRTTCTAADIERVILGLECRSPFDAEADDAALLPAVRWLSRSAAKVAQCGLSLRVGALAGSWRAASLQSRGEDPFVAVVRAHGSGEAAVDATDGGSVAQALCSVATDIIVRHSVTRRRGDRVRDYLLYTGAWPAPTECSGADTVLFSALARCVPSSWLDCAFRNALSIALLASPTVSAAELLAHGAHTPTHALLVSRALAATVACAGQQPLAAAVRAALQRRLWAAAPGVAELDEQLCALLAMMTMPPERTPSRRKRKGGSTTSDGAPPPPAADAAAIVKGAILPTLDALASGAAGVDATRDGTEELALALLETCLASRRWPRSVGDHVLSRALAVCAALHAAVNDDASGAVATDKRRQLSHKLLLRVSTAAARAAKASVAAAALDAPGAASVSSMDDAAVVGWDDAASVLEALPWTTRARVPAKLIGALLELCPPLVAARWAAVAEPPAWMDAPLPDDAAGMAQAFARLVRAMLAQAQGGEQPRWERLLLRLGETSAHDARVVVLSTLALVAVDCVDEDWTRLAGGRNGTFLFAAIAARDVADMPLLGVRIEPNGCAHFGSDGGEAAAIVADAADDADDAAWQCVAAAHVLVRAFCALVQTRGRLGALVHLARRVAAAVGAFCAGDSASASHGVLLALCALDAVARLGRGDSGAALAVAEAAAQPLLMLALHLCTVRRAARGDGAVLPFCKACLARSLASVEASGGGLGDNAEASVAALRRALAP